MAEEMACISTQVHVVREIRKAQSAQTACVCIFQGPVEIVDMAVK